MLNKSNDKLTRLQIIWWCVLIYGFAALAYSILFLPRLVDVFYFPNFFIAPIMALGSFVAGSTFLGGGAVAFPAMTKLLSATPEAAKQFSLLIQSVGMTSASIVIILCRSNIPWRVFFYYMPGVFCGFLGAYFYLNNAISSDDIKVGFTLFILCFYSVFVSMRRGKKCHNELNIHNKEIPLLLAAGMLGGAISGLIGSGADLVLFCILSMYFRIDFKTATLLSVMAMAGTALIGSASIGTLQDFDPWVIELWIIAAPVVIFGAPIGAWLCMTISAKKLFIFVSCLVFTEVLSSAILVPIDLSKVKYFAVLFLVSFLAFYGLLKMANLRKTMTYQPDVST